jgi:hypothetical protein
MPPRPHSHPWRLAAVCLTAVALMACGETAPPPAAHTPAPTPRSLQACTPDSLPEPGFTVDPQHSGLLSVGRYDIHGDIQAALIFFKFEAGVRQVYTNIPPTPAAPAGTPLGPVVGHDQLIFCDVIQFAAPDGALGFLHAFRQLRLDEHQTEITTTLPKVGDGSVAFKDSDQSFAGYGLQSAGGAEAAASKGDLFYAVSVFGPNPDVRTPSTILAAMMAAAR